MEVDYSMFGCKLNVSIDLFENLSMEDRGKMINRFLFEDDSVECAIFRRQVWEALKGYNFEE